ncbi:MAG TPA: R3H domain-containing nucleic acid-binding protein [Acidobacteriota bacterium]|nr:R3H domain-containing nucleic acid-binding protein [Acidobacteriota bacterium]
MATKLEVEEVARQAASLVERITKGLGADLETRFQVEGETISIAVEGPDSEIMLADNARLLYAINHVVNQIFYRRSKGRYNLIVDCDDYRTIRASELRLMANKAAEQVRLTGRKISLQPMPSTDRRIIHLTLADDGRVKTISEGRGRYRRVLILPQN